MSMFDYIRDGEIVPGVTSLPSNINYDEFGERYDFPAPIVYNVYNPSIGKTEPKVNVLEVKWVSLLATLKALKGL